MADYTPTELHEINQFKKVERPDNQEDEIQKAMRESAKRRNARNATAIKKLADDFGNRLIADGNKAMETINRLNSPDEETPDAPVETVATDPEAPVVVATADEAVDFDEASLSKKVTRTINGKTITKTVQEWLDAASKVEEADSYLTQAAQQLSKTNRQVKEDLSKEQQAAQAADDLEMARVMQEGSREQVVEALNKIRNQAAARARREIESTSEIEQGRLSMQRVLDANKDLAIDPDMFTFVSGIERRLVNEGKIFDPNNKVRDFELRYTEAWKQARIWHDKNKTATTVDLKKQELIKKKEKLTTVASNNSRVNAPANEAERLFNTQEEYNRYVAEQIRGGGKRRVMMN